MSHVVCTGWHVPSLPGIRELLFTACRPHKHRPAAATHRMWVTVLQEKTLTNKCTFFTPVVYNFGWKKRQFPAVSGSSFIYKLHLVLHIWLVLVCSIKKFKMCKTTRRLWAETSRECPLQSDQQTWKISKFWCTCCRVDVTWCWNVVDESKYWVAGKKLSWNSYLMVILKLSYHSHFFFFGIRVAPTFQHDALERTEVGGSTSKLGTWAHRRSTWMQHHWTDVEWESSTLI